MQTDGELPNLRCNKVAYIAAAASQLLPINGTEICTPESPEKSGQVSREYSQSEGDLAALPTLYRYIARCFPCLSSWNLD